MNPTQLLANFEKIGDAPDVIPRLRRFTLDLAVRGKLVRQDSKEEPASELLKRIRVEKGSSDRAVSKGGKRSEVRERAREFEFSPPAGWVVSTLGEVALKITDGTHQTPTYVPTGVPFISVKDFSGGRLDLSNTRFISEEEHRVLYKRCDPKRGDILIGRIGTLGRAVPVDTDDEFSLFVSVGLIRFSHKNIAPGFFRLLLNSPLVEGEYDRIKIGGGTHTNKLNLGDLKSVALPLPPLAEQRRIVARVEELMALCDRLETVREERESRRNRLSASSLARLNTPNPATFQDDARLMLDVLPAITTRPDQVEQLRQSILNLAVRGKLVQQDPRDEPATKLLTRIAAEKTRLIKAGVVRDQKKIVRDPTKLIGGLPASWQVIALGEVCNTVTSGSRGWAEFYAKSGPGFIRAQNIRFGKLRLDDLAFVNPPSNSEGSRTAVMRGDLLIVITGAGVTNPALLENDLGEAYVSQHVGLVRPTDNELSHWLLLCLMAPAGGRGELVERAYGAGKPGLNLDNIRSLSTPLPPLAEQHRIVAKVNELMILCDRLEVSLKAGEGRRSGLLTAILSEALEPAQERNEAA